MIIIDERTIAADEGKYLTNGEAYGTTVHLGKNDSAENWYEVDEIPSEDDIEENGEEASEADYIAALERFGVEDDKN